MNNNFNMNKKYMNKLETKIKDLQSRIDKAIEYIDRRDIDWGSEEHDKLVNILKGSDKDE